MEEILIFIKHHLKLLWKIIEFCNGMIFTFLYKNKMQQVLSAVFIELDKSLISFRRLSVLDAKELYDLIHSQDIVDLEYFSPHAFDLQSIKRQFRNRSFLMMGAFDNEEIIGYFFLRFFSNRKCFVGRLVGRNYRGMGIGNTMNTIMYKTAWRMEFRCLSTISSNNTAVMRAHAKNSKMLVLRELQNDYLLVEFVNS